MYVIIQIKSDNREYRARKPYDLKSINSFSLRDPFENNLRPYSKSKLELESNLSKIFPVNLQVFS